MITSRTPSRDPDILASATALRRAARRARELAFRTGTPFIVFQNGRIVNLNPAARRTRGQRQRQPKA